MSQKKGKADANSEMQVEAAVEFLIKKGVLNISSKDDRKKRENIGEIQDGQTVYRAIGIDICEPDVWGHGIGTNALRAFINYYFDSGITELYTQTWSGNTRMIRCAAKLGFVECNRYIGKREVEGMTYDALTFRLEKK